MLIACRGNPRWNLHHNKAADPGQSDDGIDQSCVDDDISVCESLGVLLEAAGLQARPFACATDFLASPKVGIAAQSRY